MFTRNMLISDANLWKKNTGKENDRPGKEKEGYWKDEERLKGQEKEENRKCSHFIFNFFGHYTVLRSSFWY